MRVTVSGPDLDALTRGLARCPGFAASPTSIEVDDVDTPVDADWIRWSSIAKRELSIKWPDGRLWRTPTRVLARSAKLAADLMTLVHAIAELPFELAAVWTPFDAEWEAAGYRPPSFSDGHLPHGWACLFKGAGHDRLVSRRWLDHGPWKLERRAGDVSVVQFHDLHADAATALAQARIGHERMGISKTGGFLDVPHAYWHELRGVYDASTRAYKIPVAVRALEQSEMLDACAFRYDKRNEPKTPVDLAGFSFVMGPDEATPYLHELWLRELACWAIVDGHETRVDTDYTPPPRVEPW